MTKTEQDCTDWGILAVASALMMYASGASQAMPDEDLHGQHQWLKGRIGNWSPEVRSGSAFYDNAVHLVGKAALDHLKTQAWWED